MSSLGIDGLVSGLNTTSLINQLMQVEAMPQTLLKSKQTSTQSFLSGLQSLNTKVASLGEAATKVTKPESWNAFTATSSSTTVTAKTSGAAGLGAVSFSVDSVASGQVTLSAAVKDDGTLISGATPSLTVKKDDGTLVTVTAKSDSLADIAKAINDKPDTGVNATVVRVSAGETPEYRIQFTSTKTGTDNAFTVYAGTTDDPANQLDIGKVRDATDAKITLWSGSGNAVTYEQSSNTFTGLMTGLDVTVSKVTTAEDGPVTVTVGQDLEAIKKLASGVVGALGVVLSDITSRTATTTKTESDGTTKVTGGLFSGDSAVRGIQQMLVDAATRPVNNRSLSEVGIVLTRDGTVTFDGDKFAAAYAADPNKVQTMVTEIASRLATTATDISDPLDGTLTAKINGQDRAVKDMGNQIEGWDRRLALRRESLQRTYSALEVSLSKMQSQSSWLAGQLAGLSAN